MVEWSITFYDQTYFNHMEHMLLNYKKKGRKKLKKGKFLTIKKSEVEKQKKG